MNHTHEVVRLEPRLIDEAAGALARAFINDPLQNYVFPDPVYNERLSPLHFKAVLKYGLQFGEVYTNTGTPRGAAVWLPPDGWEVTPERVAASGLDNLAALIGEDAADRFLSTVAHLEPSHHTDVPSAHWYVFVVGVAPEAQGTGLGRALLAPVMQRADAAGLPCYLETASPANVPFYEHLGFRVLLEVVEPKSELRLWTFRRDPVRS